MRRERTVGFGYLIAWRIEGATLVRGAPKGNGVACVNADDPVEQRPSSTQRGSGTSTPSRTCSSSTEYSGWYSPSSRLARALDDLLGDLDPAVELHAGAGRDQPAHDDVLLEPAQVVHLAADRGLGEHARRLLEARRRDERVGRERGLGDAEQQRVARSPASCRRRPAGRSRS